jgi:hypothetical protein
LDLGLRQVLKPALTQLAVADTIPEEAQLIRHVLALDQEVDLDLLDLLLVLEAQHIKDQDQIKATAHTIQVTQK